jgi:hypothetical protein
MAKDKNSFVLYCDLIHTVRKLRKEDAGDLFLHILEYVNDNNPTTNNPIVDIAFEPIKQSLKRDLKKYEQRAERSRENGKKGGRPKNPKKPKKPSGLIQNPTEPKKPDSDSVSVSVSVNVDKQVIFNRWIDYRKEIKKPIKAESTLNNLVKKFNNKPIEEVEYVVNASIENGWQGLFWDRYTPKQTKSKSDDKMMDYIKQQINQYGNS